MLDQEIHSNEVLDDDVPKHEIHNHEVHDSVVLGHEVPEHEVQDHEVHDSVVLGREVPKHEVQDHEVHDSVVLGREVPKHEVQDHEVHDSVVLGREVPKHEVQDHEVHDSVVLGREVPKHEVQDHEVHDSVVLGREVPKHEVQDHEVHDSVVLGREVPKHEVQDHEVPNNEVYDNEVPDHEFQDKVTPDHNVYDCEVQNCEIHSSEILEEQDNHGSHDIEVVDNKVHDHVVQDNDIDDKEGLDHDVATTDNPETGTHSDVNIHTPISGSLTHNSRCDNGSSLEDADETPNEQERSDNDNDDDKHSPRDCNDLSSPGLLGDDGDPVSVTEDNSASSITQSIQTYAEENTCYHQFSKDSMSTMQETALSAYDSRDQSRNEDNIPGSAQRDVTGCAQDRKASDVSHSVHDDGELNDAHASEDINCKPYPDKGVTKDVAGSALESNTEEQQQRHTSADNALEISERHNIVGDSVGQNPRNTSNTTKCGETDAVNDTTGSLTDDVEDCVSAGATAETKPAPVSIRSSAETALEQTSEVAECAAEGPTETQ